MPRNVPTHVNGVALALFVICFVAGGATAAAVQNPAPVMIGALLGLYLLFAIKVVQQWEKVAVLRLGKYVGLRGPGLCHIIPIIESLSPYVDQRVRVASVSAESTLTRDTVPVNVDAIVFWLVWNAEKSILEVENFIEAINMSAQTALRESIGRHELAQMITERETLGRELQRILDEKTNPWGITVQSVEIRDVMEMETHQLGGGAFSVVFKARLKARRPCIKCCRLRTGESSKQMKLKFDCY